MKTPILIVNFKTYKEATGKKAVNLAKIHKEIAKKTKINIILAVQSSDIFRISSKVNLPLIAQHIDEFESGRFTGFISAESIKEAGAIGTLINHAEHRIPLNKIKKIILRCKKLKLKTIVCSSEISKIKKIAKLKPDIIAFEDPSLIATGKSISQKEPKKVKRFAKMLKKSKIIPICGAGIFHGEDVRKAISLGTKGVLVSSRIVKSKDKKEAILDIINGFKKWV